MKIVTSRSRAIHEKLPVTQQLKKFPACMEPEGSIPCSQEPANPKALCNIS